MSPSPRFAAAITDDSIIGYNYLLMFGGCGAKCPLNDTWRFSAGVWTNATPSSGSPPGRYGAALGVARTGATAYQTFLFGGCAISTYGCPNGAVNDTWSFSVVALQPTWTETLSIAACSTQLCPPARFFMAYMSTDWVPIGQTLLVYGGVSDSGVVFGNTTEPGGSWWAIGAGLSTWTRTPYPPKDYFVAGSPPTPPAPRYDGGLVIVHDGLALFGGSSPTGSSLGDFWYGQSNAPSNGTLYSPPTSPSARFGETLVWDSVANYTVMNGGCGSTCGSADTWAYTANVTGLLPDPLPWNLTYYTTLGPGGARHIHQGGSGPSPPGRFNASMVLFNNSRNAIPPVILFGGMSSRGLLNDTWSFNGSSATWSNISALAGAAPAPRESAAMAFDPDLDSIYGGAAVLFGGWTAAGPSNQTWELLRNHTTGYPSWSRLTIAEPSARFGAAATYDPNSGNVVLFGGCGTTCPLRDTWNFTTTPSAAWVQCMTTACSAPPARWGAMMTYDPVLDAPILFGGCGRTTCPLGDTWAFQPRPWPVGWRNETPTGAVTPRYDGAMAYDPSGSYIILFGGIGPHGQVLGDFGSLFFKLSIALYPTWAPASIPTQLVPARVPLGRFGASMAYDPSGQYVLLFGGCLQTGLSTCGPLSAVSDTWTFFNGTWHWICTGCGPSARWDAGLAYDEHDGYFLLLGGCSATLPTCSGTSVFGDYWKYTSSGGWQPIGTFSGGARGDASLVYDSSGGLIVLYGGIGCTAGVCGDSWTYSAGTWSSVLVPGQLGARFGAAAAYFAAPGSSYVLLFGGQTSARAIKSDTWEFTVARGWVNVTPASSPGGRYDASMTYDSVDNAVVLFGGVSVHGVPLNDTWIWTLGSTPWQELTAYPPPPAALPTGGTPIIQFPVISQRWGGSMVYDPTDGAYGYTLLFGGATSEPIGAAGTMTGGYGPGQGDSWLLLVFPIPNTVPYWEQVSSYT